MWNEKNLFTGCVDVPLSKKGVEEAIEAGKRISNIPVDMIFTSSLIRAQMTAMLAMTQHRRKKVEFADFLLLLLEGLHLRSLLAFCKPCDNNSANLRLMYWL